MTRNRLQLNVKKSKYMLISLNGRQTPEMNLKIGENVIEKANELKILGVIFDK